jgi:hypothetical protein
VTENPTQHEIPLEPGDRVEFPGYGVGIVEAVTVTFLWITWPKVGQSMTHYTSEILPHLRRVPESETDTQ